MTGTPGMPIQSGEIPGVKIHNQNCVCGSKMIVRFCPCFLKKHGYKECARCLNPKCGRIIGIGKPRRKRA